MAARIEPNSEPGGDKSIESLARPAEQWLIELSQYFRSGNQVLCSTLGHANLAKELSQIDRFQTVDCLFLDLFHANRARRLFDGFERLNILCQADPSNLAYDLAVLPLGSRGETELVRDLMQSFFSRVVVDGELWVAVDNPSDRWVLEQLERFDCRIKTFPGDSAVAYRCTKLGQLKKIKNYSCEFAFRDRDRLLKAFSRPGVFSHRRIDPGARHLINTMQIDQPMKVLDMGCGSGTVSIAAAAVGPHVEVHSIDCSVRAVECTQRGAELNGFGNINTTLSDCGEVDEIASFDLVLANPPYFANFRIAELFLETASRALRRGGRVIAVGKNEKWYDEYMSYHFDNVTVESLKNYVIASGLQR